MNMISKGGASIGCADTISAAPCGQDAIKLRSLRTALLMNFIAPYRVTLLEALRDQLGDLRIFLSTRMESDRDWDPDWGSLDVRLQKNLTVKRPYRDSLGFTRELQIHVPYDTISQLVRYRPEVVISGELGLRSLLATLYKIISPKVSLLIWGTLSEHSEREWGITRRTLRRFILKRADAILVNGRSGGRYIQKFGISSDRIHFINQPVDVELFASHSRARSDEKVNRLLHVGTITARKGVVPFMGHLIEWAKSNPQLQLEMWWLGDGDQRSALEALNCPSNLSQRFCGSIPYAELPRFYAEADVLCFPSLLDEWGLVVNEAMACGLPVLGSIYSQAVEELVEEGVTGWVFDPLSPTSVKGALQRLFGSSPEKITEMRVAARERIKGLTPLSAASKIANAISVSAAPSSGKLGRSGCS